MRRAKTQPKVAYSARQVAEMLELVPGKPDYALGRIKNFVQGGRYGITPSGTSGKQRRFTLADIFRVALTNQLVSVGFEPKEVHAALKAVPESVWGGWAAPTYAAGDPDAPAPFVLLRHHGKWAVRNAQEVIHTVEHALACGADPDSVFALNLSTLFHDLFWYKIKPYLYGESKPELWTAETIRQREELKATGKVGS